MKMIFLMSLMFCASHHPVAMIISLIILVLMASFFSSIFMKSSWLSLIFILIMLGGMLILFIYMASLASNEPFIFNKMIYLTPLVILLPPQKMLFHSTFKESQLFNLYSTYTSFNNYFAIFYLLMTLLIVLEIISSYKTPLRSKL